ncbi:hypothetical protein AAY473_011439 [Plecturocebus cupreus]
MVRLLRKKFLSEEFSELSMCVPVFPAVSVQMPGGNGSGPLPRCPRRWTLVLWDFTKPRPSTVMLPSLLSRLLRHHVKYFLRPNKILSLKMAQLHSTTYIYTPALSFSFPGR